MPRRLAALLACLAPALAACGRHDPPFDQACAQSPQAIERALQAAPRRVALPSGTRLSQCVAGARADADLQSAGAVLSRAADELADRAVGGDARAALQLGYLVGAARAGARHSAGIEDELVRRLELAAARVVDRGGPPQAALERGMRIGEARG
jgi:hypothetical protein